jgi:hypothetical protein
MVVMDVRTGKVIRGIPIGPSVENAGFDPDARPIFFSGSQGLSIYHEKSADVYEDAGAVKTQQSAKTNGIGSEDREGLCSSGRICRNT